METIYKILLFLLICPIAFVLARPLHRMPALRLIVILIHTLMLTYLTIFVFNSPQWRWMEQGEAAHLFTRESEKGYRFVSDNFVLIDNSFDKMLVPYEFGDEDDSTRVVMTNRRSLQNFLRLINQNQSLVDLVVCDIGFSTPSATDQALQNEFLQLASQKNKLLLPINSFDPRQQSIKLAQHVYGDVAEEGNEQTFVSHSIYKNGVYSLPYKLYYFLNGLKDSNPYWNEDLIREKNNNDKTSFATNTFFPEMSFSDEKIIRHEVTKDHGQAGLSSSEGDLNTSRDYFLLSQALSKFGNEEFLSTLKQRKSENKRNIIFIGSFASPDEDVHKTLYGKLHGPTILLNITYALLQGKHHLRLSYLIWLLVGYFLVSWCLINSSLGTPLLPSFVRKKSTKHNTEVEIKGKGFMLKHMGLSLLEFIFVEELHFVLLFLLVFIIKVFTGQLINALSLLVYLGVFNISLHYARKKLIEPHH